VFSFLILTGFLYDIMYIYAVAAAAGVAAAVAAVAAGVPQRVK
jgi:hypothetical protein